MTVALRVLSVRQPWAYLIAAGIKGIENRSWSTHYRGPVLIHAGRRWDDEPIQRIERRFAITIPYDVPRGGIVGIAALVAVVKESDDQFFQGPFGFIMRQATQLSFIPSKGKLGLTEPTPAILDQLVRQPCWPKAFGASVDAIASTKG